MPARIAATPIARSNVPWNPAVPPPPVTGAAPGGALLGGTVTVCVTVTTGDAGLEFTPGVLAGEDVPVSWELPDVGV